MWKRIRIRNRNGRSTEGNAAELDVAASTYASFSETRCRARGRPGQRERETRSPRVADAAAVQHVNRKGDRYYLHQGRTKTGKPKYFFLEGI